MRELNVMEINEVSGAGFMESVSSAIAMGVTGLAAGTCYGGINGAAGGGLLGFGLIGQLVGVIVGPIVGAFSGAVLGAIIGWDNPEGVTALCTQWLSNFFNGNFH
ncbi:colicin V synthesis protein [Pantoea agglomerans]|nr:colicin V synthesis protein [Pantoea agglomerans]